MNLWSYISINFHTIYNWRASEASETLSGVYKFELVRYVYKYIITRNVLYVSTDGERASPAIA